MEDFKKFLSKDLKLKPLLKLEITLPTKSNNIMMKLVGSILSQQLSTVVAKVMFQRFIELLGSKNPKAEDILKIPVEKIRAIGISTPKAKYIHNVAVFMVEHKLTQKKLEKMSDDEVIELLTQIKGVGRWTVEMLLLFAMEREDIFAVDDLGIQKGMIKLFKLKAMKPKELKAKMSSLSERWKPYRSYVSLYLWAYQDEK